LHEEHFDSEPFWEREHYTNNLLESILSWRRGIEDKEDHTWRKFHLGDLSIASMDLFSMGEIPMRTYDRWLIFSSGHNVLCFIYGWHGFVFNDCDA